MAAFFAFGKAIIAMIFRLNSRIRLDEASEIIFKPDHCQRSSRMRETLSTQSRRLLVSLELCDFVKATKSLHLEETPAATSPHLQVYAIIFLQSVTNEFSVARLEIFPKYPENSVVQAISVDFLKMWHLVPLVRVNKVEMHKLHLK